MRSGDVDPDGITLTWGTNRTGFCGSGTIRGESSGVERNPWYLGKGLLHEHRVDTTPPATSSVATTSRPANGMAPDGRGRC